MYSNSMVSSCSDPAFRQQHQTNRFPLPSIPHDLVQPLRDALPKIDKALLGNVPAEALPLCQQLFNVWLSSAPRAKPTIDITKPCRKSQSTNRLYSWFSWKRKNPAVAPMTTNQNISETTWPDSSSQQSDSTSCISNRRLGLGYRRSVSFMLARIGTKVRRVIQSSSQRIHPQLKPSIESNGVLKQESFSLVDKGKPPTEMNNLMILV